MTWLLAGSPVPHWLTLITIWTVLHTATSVMAAKVPPTTWYGKLAHVWVALNPGDVMKALQAVGGQLQVPPAAGLLVLVGALTFGGATGCASTPPNPTTASQPDPHALAEAAAQTLEDAWKAAAETCLATANAQHDDTIRQKCEPVLTKARQGLLGLQSSIDAWTAADQKNWPCLAGAVAAGIVDFEQVMPAGVTLPTIINDGLALASAYSGACASQVGN